jgi:aspartate/methionine/tyrosine aminotransferase
MRNFELETFFSKWEFSARHHMTASDLESMSVNDLLSYASTEQKEEYKNLWLGYTETWGALDLREAIAKSYDKMKKENILCLAGAGEGIYMVSRVLLDKKDHAIVIVPNYQSAETIPLEVCEVSGVLLHHENNWKLDVEDVKKAIKPNTKLISINFPHNPTGSTMGKEELNDLIDLCRKNDIYLFSDEVYRGVEVDTSNQMPQIADIYEKGLSLNVLSKAYGLPGLRIGWIASADKDVLLKIERYKHYLSICNSAPSERLALIALENRELILEKNRNMLKKNLEKIESFFKSYPMLFDWKTPKGGCVAFPKYIGDDGVEKFCKSLIEESGVLLLPSSIYKSELIEVPKDHFRIGYGRNNTFKQGLVAMQEHIERKYKDIIK